MLKIFEQLVTKTTIVKSTIQSESEPAIWQHANTYKSGDLVKISGDKSMIYECQPAPYGDFCHLDPKTTGGMIAWIPKTLHD